MFSIVHTADGWVVRSNTGWQSCPFRSLLDAECLRAECDAAHPHKLYAIQKRFAATAAA